MSSWNATSRNRRWFSPGTLRIHTKDAWKSKPFTISICHGMIWDDSNDSNSHQADKPFVVVSPTVSACEKLKKTIIDGWRIIPHGETQKPPWSKPWQIDDSARHQASAAANSEEPGRPSADHLISCDNYCFLKDMFVTVIFKEEKKEKRHSAHPRPRSPHHTGCIATRAACWTLQSQKQKGPLCNGWLAHTDFWLHGKDFVFSYTSLSRLWRNGRAEERYPTCRASVLPLQMVDRRLGLSWLSWLSSLERGVFARNWADLLPYRDVTRQQSYRNIKIWVNLSMFSFGVATPADAGQLRACHA